MGKMQPKLDPKKRQWRNSAKCSKKKLRKELREERKQKEKAEKIKKIEQFLKAEKWYKKILKINFVILSVFLLFLIIAYRLSKDNNIAVLGFFACFMLFAVYCFGDLVDGISFYDYKSK